MRDAHHIAERREVRLQRTQVIWLTLTGVVALGLVFGAGVLVGRRAARIEEPAPRAEDPIAQMDADRQMHDKLTFYSQLTQEQAKNAAPAGVKPTPTPRPAAAAPQALPEGVHASPEPRAEAPERPAAPTAAPTAAKGDAKGDAAATHPGDPEIAHALSAGPAQHGEFTVQVSSFQNREEAKAFAAQLERKGFRPFVVSAAIPQKGTWYRVRLGRFSDETQAQQAKGVLAKADIPAWVLRSE